MKTSPPNHSAKGTHPECPKFFTLPVQKMSLNDANVFKTINALVVKPSDYPKLKPHKTTSIPDVFHGSKSKPTSKSKGTTTAKSTTHEKHVPRNKNLPKLNNGHKKGKLRRDDAVDDDEHAMNQLTRLRRDLKIANQLQNLLNKVRRESGNSNGRKVGWEGQNSRGIGNFRSSQNSQCKRHIKEVKRDTDQKRNDKRFFFWKKRKKKKRRRKSFWRGLFGADVDENPFLNQEFPNSQYAKYPQ